MKSSHLKAVLTAAVAALILSGCSSGHNDADTSFAQGMIPHHEQAIAMSNTAAKRGGPQVRALARQIKAAQGPEIREMSGWLDDWNEPVMKHETGHPMDMGGNGMLDDAEMARLDKATGAAFDKLWLRGMIQHHEGAIAMAEDEMASGEFAKAVALARSIVKTQQAEIDQMQRLLK